MDAQELRIKLFKEMENMSKGEMIKELEEAGYEIRHDIEVHGIV